MSIVTVQFTGSIYFQLKKLRKKGKLKKSRNKMYRAPVIGIYVIRGKFLGKAYQRKFLRLNIKKLLM